ncbi:MAG: tripartite tricarboxylate transporter TctB family protein [Desulfobacterales bacterium]
MFPSAPAESGTRGMKKANIIASIVIVCFTGFYAYLTSQLPARNLPNTLGSAFMPWLLATLLFCLAVCLLITNAVRGTREDSNANISLKEGFSVIFLALFVYVYVKAIQAFGFIVVTPFFLAALMWISGARKWKEIVLLSIASTLGIYIFFQKIFKVILPHGTLF